MMKTLTEKWYILGAALLLLGASASWPYFYYELLRWVVCGAAAYAAYLRYESGSSKWRWFFTGVAILFNPFTPFYLERGTWQVIDIATALLFLASLRKG